MKGKQWKIEDNYALCKNRNEQHTMYRVNLKCRFV